jgi:hypothetical protein
MSPGVDVDPNVGVLVVPGVTIDARSVRSGVGSAAPN